MAIRRRCRRLRCQTRGSEGASRQQRAERRLECRAAGFDGLGDGSGHSASVRQQIDTKFDRCPPRHAPPEKRADRRTSRSVEANHVERAIQRRDSRARPNSSRTPFSSTAPSPIHHDETSRLGKTGLEVRIGAPAGGGDAEPEARPVETRPPYPPTSQTRFSDWPWLAVAFAEAAGRV